MSAMALLSWAVCGLLVGYGTTVKLLGRKSDHEIDIEEST